jgi:hypothetical protein
MARKPTDEVQLKLRFEEKLRRRLERAAEQNKRSMNAEIIHRLEQSFETDPLFAALAGGDDSAKVLRMIAWAMQLQSGQGSWKDNLLSAETVRTAVNRIIAAVAKLPEVPASINIDEATARERSGQKVPQLEGRYLSSVLLAKAGFQGGQSS